MDAPIERLLEVGMISSIDNFAVRHQQMLHGRVQGNEGPGSDTPVEETTRQPEAVDTEEMPVGAEEDRDTAQRGVVRLMQEGHFRGVAAVRLRLNFASELGEGSSPDSLPPLEPPKGKGQAYQKFLDQYLSSQTAVESDPPDTQVPAPADSGTSPASVDLSV
jgi:hypothetical protein